MSYKVISECGGASAGTIVGILLILAGLLHFVFFPGSKSTLVMVIDAVALWAGIAMIIFAVVSKKKRQN